MRASHPLVAVALLVAACRSSSAPDASSGATAPPAPTEVAARDAAAHASAEGASSAGSASSPSVHVEAVAPGRVARGTRLTLRGSGFSRTANDVRFEGVGACGGYVWDIASPDGETIEFTVPHTLAEFPKTRPEAGCHYVYVAYPLGAGATRVSVLNRDGASNAVALDVM